MNRGQHSSPRRCVGCGAQLPPGQAGPFHSPRCRARWIRDDQRAEAAEVGALFPLSPFTEATA